jgi:F420-0:gamma-glutamyl ligase
MLITAVKTHKITASDNDIIAILNKYIADFNDKSILVIASKILAITQGRILQVSAQEKNEIIKKDAEYYLPPEENAYNLFITINNNMLTYSSGIDESNGNGYVIRWPENIQEEANRIREYLIKRFHCSYAGVIITDMTAIPMQRGVIAGPIGYSGFIPLRDLTGTPDLFGREMHYTVEGVLQGLAAASGVVMGEGDEQTPLAIIADIPFVTFQDRNPSEDELHKLTVSSEQDLFGSLLTAVKWEKGGTK